MIIVGIVSNDREKDYLPTPSKEQPTGGGADKFLRFINSELVALIDSTYRQIQNVVLLDILQEDSLLFMLWKINLTYSTHLYALTQAYGTMINRM